MKPSSVLKEPVLILNRQWNAVGYATVKKIAKKMFSGHCRYIDMYQKDEFDRPSFSEHPLVSDPATQVVGWLDLPVRPGQEYIQLVKHRYLVAPAVVRFDSYEKMPKMELKFSRPNLLARDNFTCQYCGVKLTNKRINGTLSPNSFTVDHVMPKVKGGKNGWLNSVASCAKCNNKKAGRTPEEAGMKLLAQPFKPKTNLIVAMNMPNRRKEWDYFLGKAE